MFLFMFLTIFITDKDDKLNIVMEYASSGNLHALIRVSDDMCVDLTADVLCCGFW